MEFEHKEHVANCIGKEEGKSDFPWIIYSTLNWLHFLGLQKILTGSLLLRKIGA